MNTSDSIHMRHLTRRAAIYIRQTTPQQVTMNRESLRMQYLRRKTRGIPRDGKALLQGIVYCGHCGYKMTVWGASGCADSPFLYFGTVS